MATHNEALEAAVVAWLESASDYTMLHKSMDAAIAAYLAALSGESGEVVERAQAAIAHLDEAGVMSAKDTSALLSDLLAALAAAEARATRDEERIAEMEAALAEAEDVFALVEHPAFPDPVHHYRVKALGREIGFGALMATASAGWREVMAEKGYPLGSEFVAGPCHGTVVSVLEIIRRARAIRTRGE